MTVGVEVRAAVRAEPDAWVRNFKQYVHLYRANVSPETNLVALREAAGVMVKLDEHMRAGGALPEVWNVAYGNQRRRRTDGMGWTYIYPPLDGGGPDSPSYECHHAWHNAEADFGICKLCHTTRQRSDVTI